MDMTSLQYLMMFLLGCFQTPKMEQKQAEEPDLNTQGLDRIGQITAMLYWSK